MLDVGEVHGVVVEGGQGANHASHDGHRVGVTAETGVELGQLFVHHRVLLDGRLEIGLLLDVRQFAVLQQIGHFKKVAVFSQLFDRIATIQQLALVAVNEGDLGLAAGGGEETGVVGKQTGLATERANIDAVVAVRRRHDREIDGSLSIDCQSCLAFGRHGVFPLQVLVVTAQQKSGKHSKFRMQTLLNSYESPLRQGRIEDHRTRSYHSASTRVRDPPCPRAPRTPFSLLQSVYRNRRRENASA
ncbi:hypothetical protein SDC9_94179 [bioreactor metagenome]|uniref:Uncharacterized protein n=1 Tax=bioreactor metagenome TaxID=1076179 RepID=A0A645A431_9ZZZZ